MATIQKLCQLCEKQEFKYTCPKCNKFYCSVNCYKSPAHLECSEEFFKSCIQEELATGQPNAREDMQKIYDILKRMREADAVQDPSELNFQDELDSDNELQEGYEVAGADEETVEDDEEEADIAQRLQGIDINDGDEVWQRLTLEERQEFQKMVESGEIMKLLPDFNPWWIVKKQPKIVVLPTEQNQDKPPISQIPKITPNIRKFTDICKKMPSPCVHFNLWNILSAYACMVRFFHGEHNTNAIEAIALLINLSTTLKYGTNFEDAEDAIISVEMEAITTGNSSVGSTPFDKTSTKLVESREQLQKDAGLLMASRYFKLAALSDILQLLLVTKQQVKKLKPEEVQLQRLFALCIGSVEIDKSKLQQILKKIEFMLSYINRDEDD